MMKRRAMFAGLVATAAGAVGLGMSPQVDAAPDVQAALSGVWVYATPSVDEQGSVTVDLAFHEGGEWMSAREVTVYGAGGVMGWVDATGS